MNVPISYYVIMVYIPPPPPPPPRFSQSATIFKGFPKM